MELLLDVYIQERKYGFPTLFIMQNPDLLLLDNYHNIIDYCCDNGDIAMLKYILDNYNINLSYNKYHTFRHSCRNSYLPITKMLYDSNISQDELNLSLSWACECGHYDTAVWLYEKGADIYAGNNHAFKWSCINGHLNIAQWLYNIDNTLKSDAFIENLINACKNYQILSWLKSLK